MATRRTVVVAQEHRERLQSEKKREIEEARELGLIPYNKKKRRYRKRYYKSLGAPYLSSNRGNRGARFKAKNKIDSFEIQLGEWYEPAIVYMKPKGNENKRVRCISIDLDMIGTTENKTLESFYIVFYRIGQSALERGNLVTKMSDKRIRGRRVMVQVEEVEGKRRLYTTTEAGIKRDKVIINAFINKRLNERNFIVAAAIPLSEDEINHPYVSLKGLRTTLFNIF